MEILKGPTETQFEANQQLAKLASENVEIEWGVYEYMKDFLASGWGRIKVYVVVKKDMAVKGEELTATIKEGSKFILTAYFNDKYTTSYQYRKITAGLAFSKEGQDFDTFNCLSGRSMPNGSWGEPQGMKVFPEVHISDFKDKYEALNSLGFIVVNTILRQAVLLEGNNRGKYTLENARVHYGKYGISIEDNKE